MRRLSSGFSGTVLAAAVVTAGAASCSLVFGLHDNQSDNGCPPSVTHTFCELFDEAPAPWPASAQMATITGAPSLLDSGCDTPPGCLSAVGQDGYASRTVQTPSGVHRVTVELHARFERIDSGVSPRASWMTLTLPGNNVVEFGVTFAHYGSVPGDYRIFLFWADQKGASNSDALMPFSTGIWYDLVLVLDVDATVVTLRSASPQPTVSHTFADFGVPTFSAADVSKIVFNAGHSTGNSQSGVTVDTIYVDLQ